MSKTVAFHPHSDDIVGWKDGTLEGCVDAGEALFLLHTGGSQPVPIRVHYAGGWQIELTVPGSFVLEETFRCAECKDCGLTDYEEEDGAGVLHMKTRPCPGCKGAFRDQPWPPKKAAPPPPQPWADTDLAKQRLKRRECPWCGAPNGDPSCCCWSPRDKRDHCMNKSLPRTEKQAKGWPDLCAECPMLASAPKMKASNA